MQYVPERFTHRGAGGPAPVLHQPRRPGVRAREPARGREGRALRPLLPVAKSLRRLFLDEFVGDLDLTGDLSRRRDHRAATGGGALRPGVPRVRRRLGRPARRRAPRVRAGVEPAHQGPRVGPAHGVPRAVDPLHPLRQPPRRPVPVLPRPGGRSQSPLGARYVEPTSTSCSTRTPRCFPSCIEWARARYPKEPGDSDFVYKQTIKAKACDDAPRHPPGGDAVERRHLRHRPGVRGAAAAHARAPAPRGAAVRDADARRAPQGHPVVPHARRPSRARRRLEPSTSQDTPGATADVVRPPVRPTSRAEPRPGVTLTDFDPEGEDKVLAAVCYPHTQPARGPDPRTGPTPRRRRARRAAARVRGGAGQPAPQAGPGVRAHRLPVRRPRRLRRVPRPPAPPDADDRMAAAFAGARLRRAGARSSEAGLARRSRTRWPSRPPSTARWRPVPGPGVLRGVPRVPAPVRDADERPRGDAHARAADHSAGPSRPTGVVCQEMHRSSRSEAGPPGARGGDAATSTTTTYELERLAAERAAEAAPRRRVRDASVPKIERAKNLRHAEQHRRASECWSERRRDVRPTLDTGPDLGRTDFLTLCRDAGRGSSGGSAELVGRGWGSIGGSGRPSRERCNNLACQGGAGQQWPQRSPGPPRSSLPARRTSSWGMREHVAPLCSTSGTRRYTPRPQRPRNPPVSEAQRGPFLPATPRGAENP